MKRGLIIISILLLYACSFSKPAKKRQTNRLKGTFTVITLKVNGKLMQPEVSNSSVTFHPSKNQIELYAGCNRMHGKYSTPANGQLKISGISSTRMACPENTEVLLRSNIEMANRYQFKNNQLILLRNKDTLIRLQEIAGKEKSIPAASPDGTYTLYSILDGGKMKRGEYKATKFSIQQQKISCTVGCNQISSAFRVRQNQLEPLQLTMTEMYCEKVDALEKLVVNHLEKTDSIDVHKNGLDLYMHGTLCMKLVPIDQ
jgi:heat shock protein HslJ